MSLRMNAAAPALMASNSWSSSSLTARAMIPALGTSRLTRWVVSMPPGAGQRQVEQDDVRGVQPGGVDGAAGILRLVDDVEVGLRFEDLAHPDAEQRVVVDEEDLHPLAGIATVGTAAPPVRAAVVARIHALPISLHSGAAGRAVRAGVRRRRPHPRESGGPLPPATGSDLRVDARSAPVRCVQPSSHRGSRIRRRV